MKKSLFAIAFVGFISLVMGTPSAQASISILTGGDAGDTVPWTPLPAPVYAYEVHNPGDDTFGIPANNTVQGITFVPFNDASPPANFTITGVAGNFEGVGANFNVGPFPNTANDTALKHAVSFEGFADVGGNFNGPMVLTIGGLTTGVTYQVDLFVFENESRPGTYDINGVSESYAGNGSQVGNVTDIRDQVAAVPGLGGGQIVVTITGIGNDGPFLNAFSVSTPEPASMSLIGVVPSILLMRRRRHA